MTTITAFEAKTRFGELLERVGSGEEIIITRHDKPVARIVPEGGANLQRVARAVESLAKLRKSIAARTRKAKTLTYAEIKSAIEEGRE